MNESEESAVDEFLQYKANTDPNYVTQLLQDTRKEWDVAKHKRCKSARRQCLGGAIVMTVITAGMSYLPFSTTPMDAARLRQAAAYAKHENPVKALDRMSTALQSVETEKASELEKEVAEIKADVQSETAARIVVDKLAQKSRGLANHLTPPNGEARLGTYLMGFLTALFTGLYFTEGYKARKLLKEMKQKYENDPKPNP